MGAASRYPQEEKREGCGAWRKPYSPVLNLDFRPECVQQILPVALGLEVHQLGLEAHPGEQKERLMFPGVLCMARTQQCPQTAAGPLPLAVAGLGETRRGPDPIVPRWHVI